MNVLHLPTTADILLLYPGESLRDQIGLWTFRHPERQVEKSFERSLPEIRALLRKAGAALVDATEDPSQATDAFLQATVRLGAGAVTMYTEAIHDGLELFVRMHGSLFLLGPMFDEQWDEFFDRLLRSNAALPAARLSHSFNRGERQRSRFANRFRGSFDWPSTNIN